MNIQERIREQKSKYSTLTASNEKDLVEVSIQLLDVQLYLDKPSEDWTPEEKDKFGSKEQLRKKEAQLLKNEEQLLKNEELLLQIKLNQMQRTQGIVLN